MYLRTSLSFQLKVCQDEYAGNGSGTACKTNRMSGQLAANRTQTSFSRMKMLKIHKTVR
jgi:hypothetical protein